MSGYRISRVTRLGCAVSGCRKTYVSRLICRFRRRRVNDVTCLTSFPVVSRMSPVCRAFPVSVVHVSGHRSTNISRLICRFWSSSHGYYVFDLSFPIDESGMSIQVVVSMLSRVMSPLFHSYHGCHASVLLFLIVASRKSVVPAQSFPVVNYGKSVPFNASRMTRVFQFMSGRRIRCVTRSWCSFRSARHMSFTGVVLKMSRVSHIISG